MIWLKLEADEISDTLASILAHVYAGVVTSVVLIMEVRIETARDPEQETDPILLHNVECGTMLIRYITGVLFFRSI